MTHQITKLASLVVMVAVTAFAANANADECAHIDRLAVKIRNNARRITRETVHYRHTPEYGHLVADSNELYRLATHIHDVTHFEGNLRHLIIDMNELDARFHHLEEVFCRVEHAAALGAGHIHGNTKHVRRLLNTIADDIHHMQEDLVILRRRPVVIAPPVRRPVYTPPVFVPETGCGYGGNVAPRGRGQVPGRYGNSGFRFDTAGPQGNGFGISIGRGNSGVHFQF